VESVSTWGAIGPLRSGRPPAPRTSSAYCADLLPSYCAGGSCRRMAAGPLRSTPPTVSPGARRRLG
jgi:hypothetical protein